MQDDNILFAKKIKYIRRLMHKTQFEFSEECGISLKNLQLIERAKANPTIDTLQLIAAYTGLTVPELLTYTYTYTYEQEKLYDSSIGSYTSYKISVVSFDGEIIACISDVFVSRSKAENFIFVCNNNHLSPEQLTEVLYDIL